MHILVKFAWVIICLSYIKNGKMNKDLTLCGSAPHCPFVQRGKVIYRESEIEQLSDFSKSHHQLKTPQRASEYFDSHHSGEGKIHWKPSSNSELFSIQPGSPRFLFSIKEKKVDRAHAMSCLWRGGLLLERRERISHFSPWPPHFTNSSLLKCAKAVPL